MQNSKLSEHRFVNGVFTTPFNEIMKDIGKENIWFFNRLPEYMWIGLVIHYYGRDIGFEKCYLILTKLHEIEERQSSIKFSSILNMSKKAQILFFEYCIHVLEPNILNPLTVLITYSVNDIFCRYFGMIDVTIKQRIEKIEEVMVLTSDNQSNLSTDIRFLVLFFYNHIGKLNLLEEMGKQLERYPCISHEDEEMHYIRPTIRAAELCLNFLEDDDESDKYIKNFWENLSKMSNCNLKYFEFTIEKDDNNESLKTVEQTLLYYVDHFIATSPLNDKYLVLLGIATYSYKRLRELVTYNLYNAISGRSITRCIIENYIMIKYLLKNESKKKNIWTEYQYYGIGQYKLVSERYIQSGQNHEDCHVQYDYIDLLDGEYKDKEFIDMDTSYFNSQSIRDKAIEVGERDLYGLLYDYDTSYEHGLWGAIRESSLIKCDNPAHQYHCVPDVSDVQKLKSVWLDSYEIMIKTLEILEMVFGKPVI